MDTGQAPDMSQQAALLRQAVGLHQQGRLDGAEALYREVLRAAPRHFDALHLLGVLALQQGRARQACELIGQALAVDPRQAAAHSNLGLAQQALGRPRKALASYAQALRLQPDYAEAHYNQGNALLELQRPQEALASYGQALRLRPDYAEAHYNRGKALHDVGRLEEALADYAEALRYNPGDADALNNSGSVLLDLKRPEAALGYFDRALRCKPDFAEALANRGNALRSLKRWEEALASYDLALRAKPDYVDAQVNRGMVLQDLQRPEEALACYDPVLALHPIHVQALNSRGLSLQYMNRVEEALDCFDRVLRIKPGYAEVLNNRGLALYALNRLEESRVYFERAWQAKPGLAEAHWNEGLALLLMGDYQRGWEKYEWRWQAAAFAPQRRDYPQPLWLGQESLRGKTLLLHAEQGFGDTIQFCRYAKLLAAQGATVLLEVQAALKPLLAGLEGVSQLFAQGEPLPAFDCHCPLLSLPLACATTLDNLPASPAYLRADPVRVQAWQAKLGATARPRIGLVWAGSATHPNDRNRSLPLALLSKLVSAQAQFVSLKKELAAEEALRLREQDIADYADGLADFAETAGLVANLDLVIAVDTAVAHLAAALGKPVWLLLPFNPDWRWLLGRGDSPWYPTVRLFRQPAAGDWDSVIAEVAEALDKFYLTANP